jgi:hypothetical protein
VVEVVVVAAATVVGGDVVDVEDVVVVGFDEIVNEIAVAVAEA